MTNLTRVKVRRRRFWHAIHDCVAPYVDIILHRGRFWSKSAVSGSVKWCCFRSCWTVLSHVMQGRPGCLLQSAGGEANRILSASALSFMRIICPNRLSRRVWIIAVSLGCFGNSVCQKGKKWNNVTCYLSERASKPDSRTLLCSTILFICRFMSMITFTVRYDNHVIPTSLAAEYVSSLHSRTTFGRALDIQHFQATI